MQPLVFWKKISSSFSLRVFVYLLSAAVIVFGLFNFIFFQYARKTLEDDIVYHGKLMVRVLAQSVRLGLFAGNEEQLRPALEAVLAEKGVVEACILSRDRETLCRLDRFTSEGEIISCEPQSARLEKLLQWVKEMQVPQYIEGDDRYDFWAPVLATIEPPSAESLYSHGQQMNQAAREYGQVIGFAGVTMDKSILHQGYREILWRNTVVGLAFLSIGSLVAYLLVQAVTQPLNKLVSDIRARGVEVDSGDEVGLLASTYDNLVRKLGESIATIDDLKNDLEKKVEERTGELETANNKLSEERFQLVKTLFELKETQGQLIHSGKMAAVGQLVAGVAHELNNTTNFITSSLPLLDRQIKGLAEMIDRYNDLPAGVDADEMLKQYERLKKITSGEDYEKIRSNIDILLNNISEGASRTTKIVRDLKGFSRPDEANCCAVDIHAGLDSTLTLLEHEYKHRIEIVRDYDLAIPKVICYASQLNQVFMNILLNAIQSIQGDGVIRIKTRAKGGRLHVVIKDNGVGIAQEVIDRVFDPFFSTKEVGEGTGLGLSISYGIVKKHGGDIVVRSKVGEGTEFEIVIPMPEEDAAVGGGVS